MPPPGYAQCSAPGGNPRSKGFEAAPQNGATESFISGAVLKRIKVKAVEQDEFIFVEMTSRAK
jgi:hypothetical protein